MNSLIATKSSSWPAPRAVLQLFKPITWFPPMWAFMCGAVSSGVSFGDGWSLAVAGAILGGPLVCASSQAVNDWFDRHVDAINEPQRPIPSGRVPGRWGLWIAITWSLVSLVYAAFLGPWVFGATIIGLLLAWAYSAPPLRLKQNGVWGPASVAVSYEGIAWFTGAAVMLQALPDWPILALVTLYSFGAYGIMVLNDFKAVEGDQKMNIRSLPVTLGVENAALIACTSIIAPQVIVVALLQSWSHPYYALLVVVLLLAQLACMRRLLRDPKAFAPWYNATGTSLFVTVMLVSAFAVG
jgi:chlorophyll/bacteriochlorophyll a synthase